ncbi:hypothetical protein AG1IA_10218 [Rhizoctonia solani AG-1 IA]|uniref:Uncharacterized protein n=1 Tax=Thanatephorus cucumeris (strain AG1-IA) TaxID=983506 RepID=L8WGB1_THACA|nr:hypothetical protein AG1IA_10218 [Rhizoctonia solani AG-1 IA]
MWMWSAMTDIQRSRGRALGRRILRARLGSWVSAGSDPQPPCFGTHLTRQEVTVEINQDTQTHETMHPSFRNFGQECLSFEASPSQSDSSSSFSAKTGRIDSLNVTLRR